MFQPLDLSRLDGSILGEVLKADPDVEVAPLLGVKTHNDADRV